MIRWKNKANFRWKMSYSQVREPETVVAKTICRLLLEHSVCSIQQPCPALSYRVLLYLMPCVLLSILPCPLLWFFSFSTLVAFIAVSVINNQKKKKLLTGHRFKEKASAAGRTISFIFIAKDFCAPQHRQQRFNVAAFNYSYFCVLF